MGQTTRKWLSTYSLFPLLKKNKMCADELIDKLDSLCVLSITDVKKYYLTQPHRPQRIMEHYKNECIGRLPYDRFEVVMREKGTDADVKEEIEKTARQIGGTVFG
jgi:hypothetical protein